MLKVIPAASDTGLSALAHIVDVDAFLISARLSLLVRLLMVDTSILLKSIHELAELSGRRNPTVGYVRVLKWTASLSMPNTEKMMEMEKYFRYKRLLSDYQYGTPCMKLFVLNL